MTEALSLLALAFAVYALIAGRLDRLWLSGPIVFVAVGAVFGSAGLDVIRAGPNTEATRLVTELTLAVILFADASTVRVREVEDDRRFPIRLLAVGLPLTIVAGTVAVAVVFPDTTWAGAALLAAILAPTDAALSLAVVTNPVIPVRVRRVLNVESGLNDGIVTPFVTLFLALVIAESTAGNWVWESARSVAVGVLVGSVTGALGGFAVLRARRSQWTTPVSEQLLVLALAFLAYELALSVDANGFIAAFVAGMVFGTASRGELRRATEFTDTVGLFSSYVVWVVFGAAFVGPVLRNGVHVRAVVYALVSLTVVRMGPVALSMFRSGLRGDTIAFIGWFGPRGLASVVFTLLAFDELSNQGSGDALVEVATWTILLSVVAHGLTARPLALAYGRRLADAPAGCAELAASVEPRVRRRDLR